VLEEARAMWKDPNLLTEIGYEGSLEAEVELNQEWIQILTTMSAYLSEALFQEALEAVRAIPYEGSRAEALVALAPHLPEALLQEALDITRAIPYEGSRAEALIALAPHLPEALKDEAVLEALETVWEFDENGLRARLLAALVPCIPESLKGEVVREALTTARAIEEEGSRPEMELATILFSSLSGPLLQEALEMAFSTLQPTNYEESKAATLTKLIPYVPESIKSEVMRDALEAARSMKKKNDRARVLIDLAPHLAKLSPSALYPLWCEALHILANRSRQDLLANLQSLAPIISVLGGSEAIVETSRAILEVGHWWP